MSKAKFEIKAMGDLGALKQETLEGVNKAIVAAAYKVRDDARSIFKASKTLYKNATSEYDKLAEGINVGKLVGGTLYRSNKRGNKGRITENMALDKAVSSNANTLEKYIDNVLKQKEIETHG